MRHTPRRLPWSPPLLVLVGLLSTACPQHKPPPKSTPIMPSQAQRPADILAFLTPQQGVRVIAHRGFSGKAPENTLVALRMAIEIQADMAEIDVGLTRDGSVVLMHDEDLERTTDGQGLLSSSTLAEVQQLDAGSWFGAEFAGEPVPTLAQALDLVRGKILLNIEIKTEAVTDTAEGGIVDKVLQLVNERRMLDQIVISSFDPRALIQARELNDIVRTASLFNSEIHQGMGPLEVIAGAGSNGFNTSHKRITRQIIQSCHRHDFPVAVYTVNSKQRMRQLIDLGVDAFFTDFPDRLQEVLAEMARQEEDTVAAAGS